MLSEVGAVMTIPAVMFIEMARAELKRRDGATLESEAKEFHSLGPARMREVLGVVPASERREGDIAEYPALLAGYLLGLETARVLLAAQPKFREDVDAPERS
jgi:hypothetical protein